jgi:hypothetical protein
MKTQSDIVRIAVNCFIFNITQTAAGVRALAAVEELHRHMQHSKRDPNKFALLGFLAEGVSIISVLIDFTCDTRKGAAPRRVN